jgi:orotidine-5'-phosphate decarboxylase
MTNQFGELWHQTRERTQSNIIAGLDPAIFAMGRGESGLPKGADLLAWSLAFVDAVAPYVAGIKINQAYFQGVDQRTMLAEIVKKIKQKDLIALSDNKIADIGATNDAWIFYTKELGFDALTCAPYAGNIEATVQSSHNTGVGIITMGLMSNPEYESEMYFEDPTTHEPLWKNRIQRAISAETDGIVVGGTFTTDNKAFMECIELVNNSDMLYLIPGIGKQGGEVTSFLASGIDKEKCMICSSRGVMFPAGSGSTQAQQAGAAQSLRDSFNK